MHFMIYEVFFYVDYERIYIRYYSSDCETHCQMLIQDWRNYKQFEYINCLMSVTTGVRKCFEEQE